ncbi:DUF2062 domain-containing protein [Aquimarina agarivorans]|uniref:DUF2062 domain-containing protein n=1 Tax=Aquimarina agarivorans TaxID=980584 RepID=UPI000248F31E|nr:DUF2062 domain-containing protein [Aquimarina agarivorans]
MKKWLKKITQKINVILNQRLTPYQLALSLVLSLVISLFPVIGLTTLVVTFVAAYFKLNFPIMISLAYLMEPVKLFLIVPFIKLGAKIFNVKHSLLTFSAIKNSFSLSVSDTLQELAYELICGFMGWAVTVIPIGIMMYFILKKLCVKFLNSQKAGFSIHEMPSS